MLDTNAHIQMEVTYPNCTCKTKQASKSITQLSLVELCQFKIWPKSNRVKHQSPLESSNPPI